MSIKEAFEKAERLESKIPPAYIQKLDGLSSPKIWHLLNNLCAQADSYLEIGTYMGSSLMAALYKNNVYATAVDNFCMKPRLRDHFFHNTQHLDFQFIEKDCFTIDPLSIPHVDLYFYDGEHSFESQYKGIMHFLPAMRDEFVYVCDDWNNTPVRDGTYKAIEDAKLQILEFEERKFTTLKDKEEWWCGIAVFKLKK